MPLTEWTGYAAALLTTASFVPQVVRTLRTRDTRAISLWMYLLFCAGVLLWAVYGALLGAWPVLLANVVTLGLALVVLGCKLGERRRAARAHRPG